MDRNQDASQELLGEVKKLILSNKYLELRELLEEYHVMDIIDVMENLDEDMKIKLFESLPLDLAASILEESGTEFFTNILLEIDSEHLKNILELMSLGDMADILKELDEEDRNRIIGYLNSEDAKSVRELLFYEEETAGSTMTKGYISVNKDMNAAQAIKILRKEAEDADTIYYIYVVDNDDVLVGVVSLRELITARDSVIVEEIMSENIIAVHDNDDREEAVRLVAKYDLVAIPVLNDKDQIKGIITVDDIIDVIEEEATEDMYKFAGTSEHERDTNEDENSTMAQQIKSSLRGRLPWLILTVIGGIAAAGVFALFEPHMNFKYESIFFYVPLIIGMGGNIGAQTASVTAINLNNHDMEWANILKEICVGILAGIICALIAGVIIFFMESDKTLYIIVSLSILINMIVGASIGVLIPSVLKKMDADVSVISTPLITTLLDITGIVIYLLITLAII